MWINKIQNKLFWLPSGLMIADAILKFFHINLWFHIPVFELQNHILWIGLVELICIAFFLVESTLSIGYFLLICYWGGIVALNLTNYSFSLYPMCMLALVAVTSYLRDFSITNKINTNN